SGSGTSDAEPRSVCSWQFAVAVGLAVRESAVLVGSLRVGRACSLLSGCQQRQREACLLVDPLFRGGEAGAGGHGGDLRRLVLVRALGPDAFPFGERDRCAGDVDGL